MNVKQFESEGIAFLKGCIDLLHVRLVPLAWEIDHICYDCGDSGSYERMFEMLSPTYSHFDTSLIGGRKISVFTLTEPFFAYGREVSVLELCDQKPDGTQKEGFDHIEVLPVSNTIKDVGSSMAHMRVVKEVQTRLAAPHLDICMDKGDKRLRIKITDVPLLEKIQRERQR